MAVGEISIGTLVKVTVGGREVGVTVGATSVAVAGIDVLVGCVVGGAGVAVFWAVEGGSVFVGCAKFGVRLATS